MSNLNEKLSGTQECLTDIGYSGPDSVKAQLLSLIDDQTQLNRRKFHENISEIAILQSNVNIAEYFKWRDSRTIELARAFTSSALDPPGLDVVCSFFEGKISSDEFYLNPRWSNRDFDNDEDIDTDNDELEFERHFSLGDISSLAKIEHDIIKRVVETNSVGLWKSSNNTEVIKPNIQVIPEPKKNKDHFMFLFDELSWLADDYMRERNWKRASAKKLALACAKVCREKEEKVHRIEKEENQRIRRQCASVAKMIRDWWRNMDKIVKAKHQVRMAAKRQQAMTTHLGQVLQTTEEYTKWLTEGIVKKPDEKLSEAKGKENECEAKIAESDDEFQPEKDENTDTDDEETIAKAEAEDGDDPDEHVILTQEADIPLEDLLPAEYFTQPYPPSSSHSDQCVDTSHTLKSPKKEKEVLESSSKDLKKDFEFKPGSDDESQDDEATMAEQEQFEDDAGPNQNEAEEVAALEAEADLPIEELIKRYTENPINEGSDFDESNDTSDSSGSSDDMESYSSENEESQSDLDEDKENENVGTSHFLTEEERVKLQKEREKEQAFAEKDELTRRGEERIKELTEEALSAQPSGNLLISQATGSVKVPFILYGQLREYQHVGLNWLSTIYEKRLNGILADEMGLGKTIQTIALLAHLACELSIWGPHLIIVPTSVLLNWEMEFKRWCPGFKILTYYGSAKERKEKRKGWTKTNAFHVCITSYRLALQDAIVFKRKKWRYLILDEAQNIKNFKSQRWQTLLTFNSQRRLLLTGTPLQNSLMELWSLMHFLMPNIFQSHKDFNEWFASPLTGMIEGNNEFNDQLIDRLHRVLRPFLLRRLKADVEKQMPKKYEHVIMCRLSRRQRFLYDDYMSWNSTRDVLQSGQFLSVMNILMQLRKVCNHPDLFETRPIISPFLMQGERVEMSFPRLIASVSYPFMVPVPGNALNLSPCGGPNALCYPDLDWIDRAGNAIRIIGQLYNISEMSRDLPGFVAKRMKQLAPSRKLITEIDHTSVVDCVTRDWERLKPYKDLMKMKHKAGDKRPLSVFFPRQMVVQVDEMTGIKTNSNTNGTGHNYRPLHPPLPVPTKFHVKFNNYEPSPNPWDTGIPKTVLQKRADHRKERLGLLERISSRRTDPLATYFPLKSSTLADFMGGLSWGDNNHMGPDTIYLLTTMTNRLTPIKTKSTESTAAIPITHLGYTDARIACTRSVFREPRQTDFSPYYFLTKSLKPIELASRFDGFDTNLSRLDNLKNKDLAPHPLPRNVNTAYLLSRNLGPDHFPAVKVSWRWDCNSLRGLLHSPADLIDSLEEILYSFNFYVPSVLVRGLRLNACSSYIEREHEKAEIRLMNLFWPFLPTVCLSSNQIQSHSLSSKFYKNHNLINTGCTIPFSLTFKSWLNPIGLHDIANRRNFSFPDPRLIQYDCGKLQRLSLLLRDLKFDGHRVLIFTQMARMLDVLEQFLAYHGHRYLRLDGTTKVEQRQVLMERFNQDSRIFVFILSTRSGGLGINLTGADTVVFYDSDWNPTMDAQAQDRCHRIGQTRDVHIYRLISEKTIEENILRKANQKRFLSDLAIEKGKFTTAFFKQNTINELFAEPFGLQDLAEQDESQICELKKNDVHDQQTIVITRSGRQINWRSANVGSSEEAKGFTTAQLAAALEQCEDDIDRVAAHRAMEEAQEDAEEFNEAVRYDELGQKISISNDFDPIKKFAEAKRNQREKEKINEEKVEDSTLDTQEMDPEQLAILMAEQELNEFESQLQPIERYGVLIASIIRDDNLDDELELADAEIEESKKTWRLDQMKALREADEEKADIEEDDMLYCYGEYNPVDRIAELDKLEKELLAEEALLEELGDDHGMCEEEFSAVLAKRLSAHQKPFTSSKGRNRNFATRNKLNDSEYSSIIEKSSDINHKKYSSQTPSQGTVDYDEFDDNETVATSDTVFDADQSLEKPQKICTNAQNLLSSRRGRDIIKRINYQDDFSDSDHLSCEIDMDINDSEETPWTKNQKSCFNYQDYDDSRSFRARGRGLRGRSAKFHNNNMNDFEPELSPQLRRKGRGSFSNSPGFGLVRTPRRGASTAAQFNYDSSDFVYYDPRISMPRKRRGLSEPQNNNNSQLANSEFVDSFQETSDWSENQPAILTQSRKANLLSEFKLPSFKPKVSPLHFYGKRVKMHNSSLKVNSLPQPSASRMLMSSTSSYGHQISNTRVKHQAMSCQPPNILKVPEVRPKGPPQPFRMPVQSVRGDFTSDLPVTQLLTPEGLPVFVVTRQVHTPGGEVVQQKFTHPVQPIPRFTSAVRRMFSIVKDSRHPSLRPIETSQISNKPNPSQAINLSPSSSNLAKALEDQTQNTVLPILHHIPRISAESQKRINGHHVSPTKVSIPTLNTLIGSSNNFVRPRVVPVIKSATNPSEYKPGAIKVVYLSNSCQGPVLRPMKMNVTKSSHAQPILSKTCNQKLNGNFHLSPTSKSE